MTSGCRYFIVIEESIWAIQRTPACSCFLLETYHIRLSSITTIGKNDALREIASKENIPLNVTQLDVDDDTSVNNAINNIIKENDRIDILVNNAGFSLFGSLEESSLGEIKQQIHLSIDSLVIIISILCLYM